jgi:hypothetical protein
MSFNQMGISISVPRADWMSPRSMTSSPWAAAVAKVAITALGTLSLHSWRLPAQAFFLCELLRVAGAEYYIMTQFYQLSADRLTDHTRTNNANFHSDVK